MKVVGHYWPVIEPKTGTVAYQKSKFVAFSLGNTALLALKKIKLRELS